MSLDDIIIIRLLHRTRRRCGSEKFRHYNVIKRFATHQEEEALKIFGQSLIHGSVGSIKCLIKTQQMLRIFIIVVCGVKKAILCDTFACYKIGGTAHRA